MRNETQTTYVTGFAPHPPNLAQRYREAGIFADRPLWRDCLANADATPDAPAVTDDDVSLTFAQFRDAVEERAAGYLAIGLAPGDRVVMQNVNSVAFAVNFYGLLRAGVIPVMALPAHRISEIAHLASSAGAVGYLAHDLAGGFDYRDLAAELVDRIESVRIVLIDGDPGPFAPQPGAPVRPPDPVSVECDAPALLLVSGGTTGLPKLIPRTHNDYAFNAATSAGIAELTSADTYLTALPAAHNFPLCCPGMIGVHAVGGHVVFTDNPSPDRAFDLIEKHRVTVTALVPALAQLWCAAKAWEPADTSSLRLLQVGGAKLAESDAVALSVAFGAHTVQQVFGMAEGLICYTRPEDPPQIVATTQGRPMSHLDEVRIVDDTGVQVPDGDDGELLVRGPYTIRAYYRAPEHTVRSFTADGFYRSGDRVRRTASGHLMVTGRIKDTIVRAGENIAADDVEENLLAHVDIRQVAVIGLPDDTLGERICAAVVVGEREPTLPELREFLRQRGLATFKQPDELRRVASLPVTAVGKIDKAVLRAQMDLSRR